MQIHWRRHLAGDESGSWQLVFIPEELHVFVEFVETGAATNPAKGMTVEDFLVTLPHNRLREEAHARLVILLAEVVSVSP